MHVIAWIVVGLAAGYFASRFATRRGDRVLPYVALGVVGAGIGGYVFGALSAERATRFVDGWSLFVALVGAVAVLVAYHAVRGRHSRT